MVSADEMQRPPALSRALRLVRARAEPAHTERRAGLEDFSPFIPFGLFEDEAMTHDFPVALDDIRPEFREGVSRQDLDGDGVITFEEGQEALAGALIADADSPYNYGEPRQVRFGVELRF